MAPTCYNTTMKNLHYRTQSLPESVYQHQMLHLTQHQGQADYHHGLHGHHGLGNPLVSHHQAHIKKRNALRRSQTSVCDLLQSSLAHHRPSPLTAGLYEQFLPPPNFNAIGLPVTRAGGHRVSRAQSFYVPGTQSSGHHYSMARPETQALHYNNYPSVCDQSQAASWYRGSVPNLPQSSQYPAHSPQPQKSVTSPLFVDCSVEYDLGEQPVIPADSEPLLTIHPEYVNKARSVPSSPYTRPKLPLVSESHKSLPDIGDKSQAKLVARQSQRMRASPRAAARMAMNTHKQLSVESRKLSVESRDSGIAGMGGWTGGPMYPGCDMMTPSSTPFMSSYPQPSEYCGGKVLPTSSSKRFALSGINPNNNSGVSSSATNNLTGSGPAANHYQNLRIYYQLAF